MRYAVTGIAGFIGSHIAQTLLALGHEVHGIDNFHTGRPQNLEGIKGRIRFWEASILDYSVLTEAFEGCSYVFHEAAITSVPWSMEHPEETMRVNAEGTRNVLIAALRAGVERSVIASSCAVYGDLAPPLRESVELPDPLSPYARSKRVAEAIAKQYDAVALRYFNVYGPRQDPDSPYSAVIPLFIRALIKGDEPTIYGDGTQTRDFVYVGDVVDANLLAANVPNIEKQVFNVGTGRPVSIANLLQTIDEVVGKKKVKWETDDPRAGDIQFSYADRRKGEKELYLDDPTDLLEGLTSTVEWFGKQPETKPTKKAKPRTPAWRPPKV